MQIYQKQELTSSMREDSEDAELCLSLRIFSYQNPVPSYFNKATPEKPAF